MRKINEAKRQAIIEAVYHITYNEGITNLSIAKIAKQVGVSKATMYVYYDNKTDMLGKIFLNVKELMDEGLDSLLSPEFSFEQRVKNVLTHFADKFVKYPYQANFMRAIQANPDLVDPAVIKQSEKMAGSLNLLLDEGKKNHRWVTDDTLILISIVFAPIANYIEKFFKMGQSVPEDKLAELVDILVKSNVVE